MRFLSSIWLMLAVALVPRAAFGQLLVARDDSSEAPMPTCAIMCFGTYIGSSGCDATNSTCLCNNEAFGAKVADCVVQNCTVIEGLVAKNASMTSCGAPVRDRSKSYNAMQISLCVISAIVVMMRLGFKLFIARTDLDWDDYFILATVVAAIPSTVLTAVGTIPNGLGKDFWTLRPQQIYDFARFYYYTAVLYFLYVTLLKMSLLFFYLKVFPGRTIKRILWGTIGFNAVFGTIFVFLTIFQCNPISLFWTQWDGEHPDGVCIGLNPIAWANACISIALDLWMLGVPFSQVRKLQLHWKKKVGVAMMFLVGTFVTIVSVIRLESLVVVNTTDNTTWDQTGGQGASLWSCIEINVGIICACMPTLRLMLVRLFPVLDGSLHSKSAYYNNNTVGSTRIKSHAHATLGSRVDFDDDSRPPPPPKGSGILYQHTYDVRHTDTDEVRLVTMKSQSFKGSNSQSYLSDGST